MGTSINRKLKDWFTKYQAEQISREEFCELRQEVIKYTDEELAKMVWQGKFGNGEERKQKLGKRYNVVQNLVNQGASKIKLEMVKKTIRGDYGNGEARKKKLGKYYDEVQHQVNLNYKNGTTNWNNIKLY